jgi:hypothetical protein
MFHDTFAQLFYGVSRIGGWFPALADGRFSCFGGWFPALADAGTGRPLGPPLPLEPLGSSVIGPCADIGLQELIGAAPVIGPALPALAGGFPHWRMRVLGGHWVPPYPLEPLGSSVIGPCADIGLQSSLELRPSLDRRFPHWRMVSLLLVCVPALADTVHRT